MTELFETKVNSIRELSDSESDVLLRAIEEPSPEEAVEETLDSECPGWLKTWFTTLEIEWLFGTSSQDAMGTCAFGLLCDTKSNECWTIGSSAEPAILLGEVEGGRSSLTPERIWALVREDDGATLLIWHDAWIDSGLVKREFLEPFLREKLRDSDLDRMGAGQGLSLTEWLDEAYGQG
jgi:hypothetical protein